MNGMDKEELKQIYASIHTLRMEGDYDKMLRLDKYTVISIHTLRMEGDQRTYTSNAKFCISIHTLRMEGDPHG